MHRDPRGRAALAVLAALLSATPARAADFGPGFVSRAVPTDPGTLELTTGGSGPPVVLLHGYGETSQMWRPLATVLSERFTVLAFDLPGIGDSSIPTTGLDPKTAAARIHAAVQALGYEDVQVVGHDIGLMVAYAYAASYPDEVQGLALLDAFLPGVEGWEAVYDSPDAWHFRFYGPTPEALVEGRERLYLEHFWNDFAADPKRSVPEADRRVYADAYAGPGRMAAGFAYFASFPATAVTFAELAKNALPMPVLTIGGDRSLGAPLGEQAKRVARAVEVVVLRDTGHWVLEERPEETISALDVFLRTNVTAPAVD